MFTLPDISIRTGEPVWRTPYPLDFNSVWKPGCHFWIRKKLNFVPLVPSTKVPDSLSGFIYNVFIGKDMASG
jgi:hypothetical protein